MGWWAVGFAAWFASPEFPRIPLQARLLTTMVEDFRRPIEAFDFHHKVGTYDHYKCMERKDPYKWSEITPATHLFWAMYTGEITPFITIGSGPTS